MPRQTNSINVQVYAAGEAGAEHICHEFEDVHYISLVNEESYGIPAIISEDNYKNQGLPIRVLYINPTNVVAIQATRLS